MPLYTQLLRRYIDKRNESLTRTVDGLEMDANDLSEEDLDELLEAVEWDLSKQTSVSATGSFSYLECVKESILYLKGQ